MTPARKYILRGFGLDPRKSQPKYVVIGLFTPSGAETKYEGYQPIIVPLTNVYWMVDILRAYRGTMTVEFRGKNRIPTVTRASILKRIRVANRKNIKFPLSRGLRNYQGPIGAYGFAFVDSPTELGEYVQITNVPMLLEPSINISPAFYVEALELISEYDSTKIEVIPRKGDEYRIWMKTLPMPIQDSLKIDAKHLRNYGKRQKRKEAKRARAK